MILFFLFGCCIAVVLSALDGDAFLFVWAHQISSLDAQRSFPSAGIKVIFFFSLVKR